MARRKTAPAYRDYYVEIDGKGYGSVYLPDPVTGKLKPKRKRMPNRTAAREWGEAQIAALKANGGKLVIDKTTRFGDVATWFKEHFLVPPVIENGVRVDGLKGWQDRRSKLDRITEYFGGIAENDFTYEEKKDPANFVIHRGGREILELTQLDYMTYSRWRMKNSWSKYGNTGKVSQRSINDDFALIRAMLNAAKSEYPSIVVPTFKKLIVRQAEVVRDRLLDFDEERKLLAQCFDGPEKILCKRNGKTHYQVCRAMRAHVFGIIIFALNTAIRRGEIFKLDWKDVDLKNEIMIVIAGNAKSAHRREVPINAATRAVLEALPHRKGKVFKGNDCDAAFATAVERAGLDDLLFHDLRHTATTRMIQSGTPHMEVMKITGHRTMDTFLRYMHITGPRVSESAGHLLDAYNNQQMAAIEVSSAVN